MTHLVLLLCKREAFVAPPPPPPKREKNNLCKCELFWALCCKQKFPSHRHKLCKFNLSSVLNFYVADFFSNPGKLLLCSWWSVGKKPLMSSEVHHHGGFPMFGVQMHCAGVIEFEHFLLRKLDLRNWGGCILDISEKLAMNRVLWELFYNF